jgi:mannose-6-phosphate isomerase-like protein (cupin superfamily)
MVPLKPFDPRTEFFTDEGCYIVELSNSDDDETCSIARARVAPGVTTKLHYLDGTVERYVILDGEGAVTVGDSATTPVRPYDVVTIPAGTAQQIRNTGTTDLIFLCVCTPRFRPSNYVSIDGQ